MMTKERETGFDRPKEERLPGTVKFYQRHLFVCTPTNTWPARIESDGGFVQAFSRTVESRDQEISLKVKLTACHESTGRNTRDLLVFPDQIRYRDVREDDISSLVDEHLVRNTLYDRLDYVPLTGRHIFVCTHANRDRRCGRCGPILLRAFDKELQRCGERSVQVRQSSHVGGHRFAGNVLIYPDGDWYGYVRPDDVPHIVEQHLLKGRILWDLWRGRMGLAPEAQILLAEKERSD